MGVLAGKVALVTGAGHGIGRAIAQRFAREGARLVVNDRGGDWHGEGEDRRPAAELAEELRAQGAEAVADHGDVADTDAAAAMVAVAVERFGALDVVVNCAGILRDRMLVSMEDSDWDTVIRVHLRGHFAVTRAAARHWRAVVKERGEPVSATVFNIASEAGLYGNVGQANYSAAKGGIASFGLTVANELSRYGVRSHVIAPRARTRMTEGTFGDALPRSQGYDNWDPGFVAPLVVYLASEAGSPYTGQIFVVGGGVLQRIAPYQIAHAKTIADHEPTLEEVAAFVEEALGGEAAPPPTAAALALG